MLQTAAPAATPPPPAAEAPLLAVDGLEVRYGVSGGRSVSAVDHVSLDVHEGEVVGLVGESGCGKSSLARGILRLLPTSAGSVRLLGQDLTALSGEALRGMRRHMQMVFQDPRGSLDPRMRIRDIVEEPLKVHGLAAGRERTQQAREMLARVGLDEAYDRRWPSELSGGQQQRIGIARALITRPKLVVCDEPVSSLDVSIQAQVLNLLQDLQQQLGLAYLFIAHNLAVVRHIADRVAVMYLGQIVEEAPSEDLFRRPLHPYTQGLVASTLRPDLGARAQLAAAERLTAGDVPSALDPPPGCRYHTRCPYARARCQAERPALEVAETAPSGARHRVACHFWREVAALPAEVRAH